MSESNGNGTAAPGIEGVAAGVEGAAAGQTRRGRGRPRGTGTGQGGAGQGGQSPGGNSTAAAPDALPWGDAPDGGPEVPPVNPNTDERFTFGELAGCRTDRISVTGQHHRVEATYSNLVEILDQSELWAGTFAFDEFKQRVMVMRQLQGKPGPRGGFKPRPFTDADERYIRLRMAHDFMMRKLPKGEVHEAVHHVAEERAFDPLKDYLNGLKWDGVPRIDSFFATYFGAEGPKAVTAGHGAPVEGEEAWDGDVDKLSDVAKYNRQISRKFLIAMVARGLEPGCKVDNMAVLEGMQGVGKSTALRVLAGKEWFSDSLSMDLANKDSMLALAGKWLVEMPELGSLRRSEKEQVKAFITRQVDEYRPPYGRETVDVPRRCVIAGTTNQGRYLKDDTGNRRFWPVACSKVDTVKLAADRDQLFAEAVVAYHKGAKWYFEDEAGAAMAEEQADARYEPHPWENAIFSYLVAPSDDEVRAGVTNPVPRTEISVAEIQHDCFGLLDKDLKGSEHAIIAESMKRLGWTKKLNDAGKPQQMSVSVMGGSMKKRSFAYVPVSKAAWLKRVAESADK